MLIDCSDSLAFLYIALLPTFNSKVPRGSTRHRVSMSIDGFAHLVERIDCI